jgi:branched-chain amino acid transport system ATP-binding protein/urea transport system ATP-binding protein
MLKLSEVHAGYRRTPVLQGVDLTIAAGERVAVLGRNGVGKTTLLRAIVGEIPLMAGSIQLKDRDVATLPTHERARLGVAYVPQGREIFPGLSVLDNLRVASFGTGRDDLDERLDEQLTEFPVLAEKRRQRGDSLSGGQQQILALARALMTGPSVLLLDEPSEGIQPSIVSEIGEIVLRLNERRGITVVLVEQNLDFAARVCERAFLMDKGSVVRDMPAADVANDRELQHEYMGV